MGEGGGGGEFLCDCYLFFLSSGLCECACMCAVSWKERCHILPS